MILAAVDIGSNAVRLLISRVYLVDGKPYFSKEELFRMPVRLGEDVFKTGLISEVKIQKLKDTLMGFKALMKAYDVSHYKAVATSAMRDAENGNLIIQEIYRDFEITIEIIDGKKEARMVFENHIEEQLNPKQSYMYIDVGGGSTEITLYHQNAIFASNSFNIGTVRLLLEKVPKSSWEQMKDWIKDATKTIDSISAIGSGGNINKIFKMYGKREAQYISFEKLKHAHESLNTLSIQERIERLHLKPDRADVIVHAAKIYLSIMKQARIERMFVPQVGLSDGLIHELYLELKKSV